MFDMDALKAALPELPWETRKRFSEKIKNTEIVESFVQNKDMRDLLDTLPTKYIDTAANYIAGGYFVGAKPDSLNSLGKIIDMISEGEVNSTGAKILISTFIAEGGSPEEIAKEKGLLQQNDEGALREIVKKIITENEGLVLQYKGGKESIIQALVGLMMKETKGSANPQTALKLFKEELS